jgi:hypothetical protein
VAITAAIFRRQHGRRVLVGLTVEETFEFETLDWLARLDERDNYAGPKRDGIPTVTQDERWRKLYAGTTRRGDNG